MHPNNGMRELYKTRDRFLKAGKLVRAAEIETVISKLTEIQAAYVEIAKVADSFGSRGNVRRAIHAHMDTYNALV